LAALEREVRKLKRTHEILKTVSACFAQAALDRPSVRGTRSKEAAQADAQPRAHRDTAWSSGGVTDPAPRPDPSDAAASAAAAVGCSNVHRVLMTECDDIERMASEPLSRDVAVARLAQAEADIRALGVARLALFGSVARDEARADSDVDLLVQFAPGEKSFGRFMALCDLLESVLQHKVELVTTESLSPFIGPRILAEAHDVVPNRVPELRRQLATILTQ